MVSEPVTGVRGLASDLAHNQRMVRRQKTPQWHGILATGRLRPTGGLDQWDPREKATLPRSNRHRDRGRPG